MKCWKQKFIVNCQVALQDTAVELSTRLHSKMTPYKPHVWLPKWPWKPVDADSVLKHVGGSAGEKEPEDVIAADTNTFVVGDSAHVSWIQSMSQHPTWSFWSPGTKAERKTVHRKSNTSEETPHVGNHASQKSGGVNDHSSSDITLDKYLKISWCTSF